MNQPSKPNLIRFIEESASEELHLVLRGHLHIEALLNEIIRRSFPFPSAITDMRQSFYNKTKLLRATNRIDDKEENLLLAFNSLRNRIAHQLHFTVTFPEVFSLVQTATAAGVDFSDNTIHSDIILSEKWYGVMGVLAEVISNTFQHLILQNKTFFSQDDISDFLG